MDVLVLLQDSETHMWAQRLVEIPDEPFVKAAQGASSVLRYYRIQ